MAVVPELKQEKVVKAGIAVVNGVVNGALLEYNETAFLAKTVIIVLAKLFGVDVIPDEVANSDAGCLGMKLYAMLKKFMGG